MAFKPAPEFLHRPPGVEASPIGGGSVARPYRPVRAVLQTRHGGVLVRAIVPQPDGTFSGEAYGVMPQETAVARGQRVRFVESQIFSFNIDAPPADDDMAQMLRAFKEGALGIDDPPRRPEPAPFDLDLESETAQPPPARDPPHTQPAAHAKAHPPTREDAPMQTPSPMNEEPLTCAECGAKLPAVHDTPPETPAGTPPPSRVTCRACGRINDLAEARAAALRHRSA